MTTPTPTPTPTPHPPRANPLNAMTRRNLETSIDRLDRAIAARLASFAVPMLRIGLAIVFVWFGALKVAQLSPATDLVARTTDWAFNPAWFVPLLGWWEIAIGLCLLDPLRLLGGRAWLTRIGIALLALQIPGTFLPLVMVPDRCFDGSIFALTLEGQYIIKNLVLIAAAMALGATVRDPSPKPKIAA